VELRLALVTGGTRGIGEAISDALSRSNFVVSTYHEREVSHGLQVDIGSRESIRDLLDKAGFPDILVNNAAISQEKPFEEITDSDWDHLLSINLGGAFRLCQECIPKMVERGWGRVINITSIGGQWGGFNQVHYAAAKAGLINLTQSLARIYSQYGVTVNAVSPGLVNTEMSGPELETEAGGEKVRNIPIGRIALPEEIASVVGFLASVDASYITGQTINVNGGMYFG